MTKKDHLVKAAGMVGSATLLSRLLGFIRDILIAGFFGTSAAAESFVVAFRIPNLLRDLVGEGAANAAFVPVLTEYLTTKSRREFWELVHVLLNILFVVLVGLAAAGVFFTPVVVRVLAPGFISEPEKFALTVRLTRLLFPYILIVGLTAYAVGVLNSFKSFAAPAIGPALLNVCMITSVLFLREAFDEPVVSLAVGVLLGGIAQFSVNIPDLLRKGFRLSLKRRFRHPAAAKIVKLLIPRALGSCVYQANVFIDTILASLAFIVGEGGVAALYYSNRLIQLPLAIFGIAMATAALPSMSEFAAKKDFDSLKKTLAFSLRTVFYITMPAAAGLFVLGEPIVRILFQRGQFSAYSTSITSSALLFYTFGLFAYAGIKILVNCFYSMQDTKTPVKIASAGLLINLILNLILMRPLKIGGLALATSMAATINFFILLWALRKRIGKIGISHLLVPSVKILAAGVLMGIFCWWFSKGALPAGALNTAGAALALFVTIISGMAVFYLLTLAFGVKEAKAIKQWISGKR